MFDLFFSGFSVTWLLSLIPNFLIHGIFLFGLIGFIVLSLPVPLPSKTLYKIVAGITLLLGTWLEGAVLTSNEMLAEIKKQRAKIIALEKEAKQTSANLAKDFESIAKQINQRGDNVLSRITDVITKKDDNSCSLPNDIRVLHDEAATSNEVSNSTRRVDGKTRSTEETVKLSDLTKTTVQNYTTCNETRAQLEALQNWVRAMERIHNVRK
ncbi:hypothetical protein EBU71_00025 [bacterium]|nr:hypothetical protein [Candidatus Elulimicrobium humile]